MSKHEKEHKEQESESLEINRAELEELKRKSEELAQLQDRLLRSAADFENAKKRLAKEREDFVRYGLEDFILRVLPVLDNFNFALSHIVGNDDKTKSMREGFLLIQKQLLQVLSEYGVKPLEVSRGKIFDPHFHEPVGSVVDPKLPEGSIVEEVQTGYELNGKLLRPAKVKISTKSNSPDEKEEDLT